MTDPRLKKLANLLTDYSVEVKDKENVLIVLYGTEGMPLLKEVYRNCIKKGAFTKYEIVESELNKVFFDEASKHQLEYMSKTRLQEAKETDVLIQIVAESNRMELANSDQKKIMIKRKATKKISDEIHKSRWVLFEYPTRAYAQNAKMSTEEWEDFVFQSCLIDWKKASKEQEVLKQILEQADSARIVGEGTDLTINIKGQKCKKCDGHFNMPDGEVFTSPVKDGVDGYITFNTPTVYMGKEFNWIKLTFKKGKAIKAESDINTKELNDILDTDKGSRFVGEFAFGLNRGIHKPVRSILFDEKIGGSNHMALGKCYDQAPNGNDSAIHWDMIIRHKEAKGEVYLDGKLVQKHGKWVDKRLTKYN
jgi:aminopeptidase